jgi:hypothetical protein
MHSGRRILTPKPPSKGTWRGDDDPFQAWRKVPRLPNELWYHISGHLVPPDPPHSWFVPREGYDQLLWDDYPDIASCLNLHLSSQETLSVLCRVSKSMTHIARRFLYQKIMLASAEALEMLYRTVREVPALRRRIERLFCTFDEYNTFSMADPYTLIPDVLSILSVSDLYIPAGIIQNWDWTRQAPSGTFNPGLIKHLRLYTTTGFPSSLAWLSRFPALETLIVSNPNYYHNVDVHDTDKDYEFPKLKHLDLYDASIPEDKLARMVLACPSLERLVVHLADDYLPSEDSGPPSLDEALRARAPTLRHLELRAPELDGNVTDPLSPAVGGCIPELTNLQELVIDLPSLFGSSTPALYASDRACLEKLPSSLCRLEIMCQWRCDSWDLRNNPNPCRRGWDDDADGTTLKSGELLEAWSAAILLYWLHVIHDGLQCLPPPKDGRPFQLTLSLPGPWDKQSDREWRKYYYALMTVAAGYFGDSNTVEFRAERLPRYLDNGRSMSLSAQPLDGLRQNRVTWPEGSLLPYCRATHEERLRARALLGMRQVDVPKPASHSNSAA